MPFPFSFEDRIEVRIDSPEKAARVAEGIQQWLLKQSAREVRWDGPCLRFQGPPYPRWRRRPLFRNALRGVDESKLQFQNFPEKVVIDYSISLEPLGIVLVPACIFVATVAGGIAEPRVLLFLPMALLVAVALAYAGWFGSGRSFRPYFEVAAIRGLADGAAREYEALRSR